MVGVLGKELLDLLAVVIQLRLRHPQLPGARHGQTALGLREGLRGRKGQRLGEQVQSLLVGFGSGQLVGMGLRGVDRTIRGLEQLVDDGALAGFDRHG
jgi:hypothetical protein